MELLRRMTRLNSPVAPRAVVETRGEAPRTCHTKSRKHEDCRLRDGNGFPSRDSIHRAVCSWPPRQDPLGRTPGSGLGYGRKPELVRSLGFTGSHTWQVGFKRRRQPRKAKGALTKNRSPCGGTRPSDSPLSRVGCGG